MFHLLAFLLLLLPSSPDSSLTTQTTFCNCPEVSGLQKTGQTSNAISYAWSNAGAQYKLWYTREEDTYTSSFFYTYNTSYSFTGLSAGHYTFYFQALCGAETSGYIGDEIVIAQ